MSGKEKPRGRSLLPTPRGVAQAAIGLSLLAAGVAGGCYVAVAAGSSLLIACVTGLLEVLLARSLRARRSPLLHLLPEPERVVGEWVRLDQHGRELGRSRQLPSARGLYRQWGSVLVWHDAFGSWRASAKDPSEREVCVPPAPDESLARRLERRGSLGVADLVAERDASGVRPYEKGDGLRKISWRQSAHHGELMSFEEAGPETPSVLVVADTLAARDPDALATAIASVLGSLQRNPDVLLFDGESSLRTPVRQERFLASLMADEAAPGGADATTRARAVERLAASGRRHVVLVSCERGGALERELRRGPLARSLVVVHAARSAGAADAREGTAEIPGPPSGRTPNKPQADTTVFREIIASLCCCALGALTLVPLTSVFHRGQWELPCLAMLLVGATAGSLVSGLLRVRRVRAAARALAAPVLALALLIAGLAIASSLFEAQRGFPLLESTAGLTHAVDADAGPRITQVAQEADPLGALTSVAIEGVAQLAGTAESTESGSWCLLIVLGCAVASAVAALLASSRALRCAVALVPLAAAVADQVVMGVTRPVWTAAVIALGLLLARAAGRPSHGVVRAGAVVLLACALGAAGSALAWATQPAAAPSEEAPASTDASRGTRIETLVDLSSNLTRNSTTVALTYTTTAGKPLYLRLGILDRFDGSEWRFSDGDSTLDEEVNWSLYERIVGYALGEGARFTATIWTEGENVPAPPGTRSIRSLDERTYAMGGTYVEPLREVSDADAFVQSFQTIVESEMFLSTANDGHATELEVPRTVPESVSAVVEEARAEGVQGDGALEQVEAVRWLMAYFSSGGFTYSTSAPGGDGQDNLAVIGDFLESKRGYCTHYATAFSLLARMLGVPSRVVMGYLPADETDEDGSYVVTMRQLHSWSEVWVEGIGWVGVDVTPAANGAAVDGQPQEPGSVAETVVPEAPEPLEETGEVSESGDEASGPAEQNEPQEEDAADEQSAKGAPELPTWVVPVSCVALAGVGAGAAVALARRARRRRLLRGDWEYAWRLVCRSARKRHLSWGAEATEKDVAELICQSLEDGRLAADVREISRNACLSRYGDGPVGADASRLPTILSRLT